ncbi:hypothetical protein [Sphingomonas sp. MMS24-J13]|uniref:hypothetical protein n=1 Tax=Sphingomonas sp. MMS24-J13 TaxID=3238686 RepID=UPI003851709E
MAMNPPADPQPRWADNSNSWPALAAMLAPSAGCDCQMLAIMIADSFELASKDMPKPAPTVTGH